MRERKFLLFIIIACLFVSCKTSDSAKTEKTEIETIETEQGGLVIQDHNEPNQNAALASYMDQAPAMNSILEYVVWRGDVSFDYAPLNEVDALIFSELSYINYSHWLSSSFENMRTLKEIANDCHAMTEAERERYIVPHVEPKTLTLLYMAGNSTRFGSLDVCGYAEVKDTENVEQFAAVTFCFGKSWAFSGFRGTDDSLVGWKEDFNMAYLSPVPAQADAVKYVEEAAKVLNCDLALGGHSKGGNLAIYAAAFSRKSAKDRVKIVYNFDGPGFENSIIQTDELKSVIPIVHTFLPKASIIGILFQYDGKCVFVENDEKNGILQHNPFSWYVYGTRFVYADKQTTGSVFVDLTTKRWLSQLDKNQLETFVNVLFDVLGASDASSVHEIAQTWYKKPKNVIKYINQLDSETKEVVLEVAQVLFYAAKENVPIVSDLKPKRKLFK